MDFRSRLTVTNFDTSICVWRVRLRKKTHQRVSAKKTCVDSDSNGDEPEEEKTAKVPTIRIALRIADE